MANFSRRGTYGERSKDSKKYEDPSPGYPYNYHVPKKFSRPGTKKDSPRRGPGASHRKKGLRKKPNSKSYSKLLRQSHRDKKGSQSPQKPPGLTRTGHKGHTTSYGNFLSPKQRSGLMASQSTTDLNLANIRRLTSTMEQGPTPRLANENHKIYKNNKFEALETPDLKKTPSKQSLRHSYAERTPEIAKNQDTIYGWRREDLGFYTPNKTSETGSRVNSASPQASQKPRISAKKQAKSYLKQDKSYINRVCCSDFKAQKGSDFKLYLEECKEDLVLALKARRFFQSRSLSVTPLRLKGKMSGIKTLLVDLDETLIHAEDFNAAKKYDIVVELSQTGNYRADRIGVNFRPYCRQFLERMSKRFEVIIFTAGRQDYADKMLDLIDPQRSWISHRLYRHHCSKYQGICVKDFRILSNRKKEDMMIVDNYIYSFAANLDNGIPIKPYYQGKDDCELESLASKLETIQRYDVCAYFIQKTFFLNEFYSYLLRKSF